MMRQMSARGAGLCLLLAGFSGGCAKDKPTEEQPAPKAEVAAKPEREPKTPRERVKQPWELPPPPVPFNVNPQRIPVEEDFAAHADQRIGKNANLKVELERLSAEIRKSDG